MYVGKNNIQNENLTFKVANGNDWWFHSKTFPGSHVIVKCEGKELPDATFEEVIRLVKLIFLRDVIRIKSKLITFKENR